MSEVAGRLAVQEGAFYLGRPHGGRGILLSGVPRGPPGNVVLLGAGTAGLPPVSGVAGARPSGAATRPARLPRPSPSAPPNPALPSAPDPATRGAAAARGANPALARGVTTCRGQVVPPGGGGALGAPATPL